MVKKGKIMTIARNNHVFKGHKALMGNRYVTYGEVELPTRYEQYSKSKDGFDWGTTGSGSQQLAFSILRQLSDENFSREHALKFSKEVISSLNSRDWILSALEVVEWIDDNTEHLEDTLEHTEIIAERTTLKPKRKKSKRNVVKDICIELGITQKELAHILEVPEGTISSWAVKNEIPRLGKKAMEFYMLNAKNQKIVDSYKNFMNLLKDS